VGYQSDWAINFLADAIRAKAGPLVLYQWSQESLGSYFVTTGDTVIKIEFLLALAGLGGDIISKGFVIVSMSLAGLTLYYLCRTSGIDEIPSLIAGIVYMGSPVVFNWVNNGGLWDLLTYSLAPAVLAFYIKAQAGSRDYLRNITMSAFLLMMTGDLQAFLIIFTSMILVFLILNMSVLTRSLKRMIQEFVFFLFLFILCNFNWTLPFLLYAKRNVNSVVSGSNTGLTLFARYSPTLFYALGLRGILNGIADYFSAMLYYNPQLQHIWIVSSIGILGAAFAASLLAPKNRILIAFLLVAALFTFLGKGTQMPFGDVNAWIFANVPLFFVFRDPYHFLTMSALALAVLFAFWCCKFVGVLGTKIPRGGRLLAYALIVLLVVSYTSPFLTGKLTQTEAVYEPNHEYQELLDSLSHDPEDYRVLMLPMWMGIKPEWSQGGSTIWGFPREGLDPMLGYYGKSNLASSIYDASDSDRFINFLMNAAYSRGGLRTPYLGILLSFADVKYVVVRSDFESANQSYNNADALLTLKSQTDIALDRVYGGNISVFKVLEPVNHLYGASGTVLIAGDLSTLISISNSDPDLLQATAVLYASQLRSSNLTDLSTVVVIDEDSYWDLAIPCLAPNHIYEPGLYASDNPYDWLSSQYWPVYGYDWGLSGSLDNGALVNQHEATLKVPFRVDTPGQYSIWIKAFLSPVASALNVAVDNISEGTLSTKTTSGTRFAWFRIPSERMETGDHVLTITSTPSGKEAVSLIVIAPQEETDMCTSKVASTILPRTTLLLYGTSNFYNFDGFTSVREIFSPVNDKYQVDIVNTPEREPVTVILSVANQTVRITIPPLAKSVIYGAGSFDLAYGLNELRMTSTNPNSIRGLVFSRSPDLNNVTGRDYPTVSYQKINPTKYEVRVETSIPLLLVFSETYDDGWSAWSNGYELQHFEVNGYANGYLIETKGVSTISIQYDEQTPYEIGLVVSVGTFLTLLLLITAPESMRRPIKEKIEQTFLSKHPLTIPK